MTEANADNSLRTLDLALVAGSAVSRPGLDIEEVASDEQVIHRCHEVRELLASRNIRLHRDSELSKLLRDADQVARSSLDKQPSRRTRQLVRAAYANRVASAIVSVGKDEAAWACLKRMSRHSIDPLKRTRSQAKDAVWEIELAAVLRRLGLTSNLAEPDLVIDVAGESYPIACKKVYSEKGVEARMRSGISQLEAFGAPGLVAFNLDDLAQEDSFFVSQDPRSAGDNLAALNRQFVDRHAHRLSRFVLDGRCHGVLVTTSVVVDFKHVMPGVSTYSQSTIWTPYEPGGAAGKAFDWVVKHVQHLGAVDQV